MPDPVVLQRFVRSVAREVRLRRAEYYGTRGLFAGAVVAAAAMLLRDAVSPAAAIVAAVGLPAVGGVVGVLLGLLRRCPPGDAARLADRGYGLQERVSTSLEWAQRDDRPPLADLLVADTVARVQRTERRAVVPRRLPRETKLLPVPLALVLALVLAPPLPLPTGGLPGFLASTGDEEPQAEDHAGRLESDERPRPAKGEVVQRSEKQEPVLAPRQGGGGPTQQGDLAALFKDTALASRAPDFNSFLKKGDDRLRMLGQTDRLPDLQRDYTQSQHRLVFQRAKALLGGMRPDQISPEKLRELLNEMERLGRKGGPGGWSGDTYEGMEALDEGQTDRAIEAMERALNKMRSLEERGRDGRGLRGGREGDRRGSQRGDRGAGQGAAGDEGDFPDAEGMMPGRGKSPSRKGDPTDRLAATPFDVGVEGEARPGRKEGFDTNLLGRGATAPSRLQYLNVMGQYRKMMEEALAREQVPREYQGQVKEYFQALEER